MDGSFKEANRLCRCGNSTCAHKALFSLNSKSFRISSMLWWEQEFNIAIDTTFITESLLSLLLKGS